MKIKFDLQQINNEQMTLDQRYKTCNQQLLALTSQLDFVDADITRSKQRIHLYKSIEQNLQQLIKECDRLEPSSTAGSAAEIGSSEEQQQQLSSEIDRLERENIELKDQLKTAQILQENAAALPPAAAEFHVTNGTSNHNSSAEMFSNKSLNMSPTQQQSQMPIDDPFQAFDPFNSAVNNDPFSPALSAVNPTTKPLAGDDLFSNAFDPFSLAAASNSDAKIQEAFDANFSDLFATTDVRLFKLYEILGSPMTPKFIQLHQ